MTTTTVPVSLKPSALLLHATEGWSVVLPAAAPTRFELVIGVDSAALDAAGEVLVERNGQCFIARRDDLLTADAPVRCSSTDEDGDRCDREAGHEGYHTVRSFLGVVMNVWSD